MSGVLILGRGSPEAQHSPEFRYLRSWNLAEAQAVFERVVPLLDPAPRGRDLDRHCDQILFLTDDHLLIGRRSLAAMLARLGEGYDVACPQPLAAAHDLSRRPPIYTLRGYERAEAEILAAGEARSAAGSHLPVSLWRREALARVMPQHSWSRLLDETELLAAPAARGLRIAPAGIYHRFIDYYAELRSDVLPLLPEGVREVLEIGCGRGVTGKLLQERLGCRVTGVELNPVVAQAAQRNLSRVLCGDVEAIEIPGTYDLIMALELFEHLTRQEEFLTGMRSLLNPGGAILLSVPNVGHWSVVEDLLVGRWDYLPIGLLCYTHYRFFTRATLENWIARCGFKRFRIVAQETELPAPFTELARRGFLEVDLQALRTKGFYVLLWP